MGLWESAVGQGRRAVGSFEALEARALLAAPVAHLDFAGTTSASLTFQVTYSSDRPIDVSTITGDEFRLTRVGGGYEQVAALIDARPSTNNRAQAWYRVMAPADHVLWSVADNGRYVVHFAEGSVANADGEVNGAADIHTFSLWFSLPGLEFADDQRLDVYGMGYTGLADPSGRVSVFDQGRVDVRYLAATLSQSHRPLVARLVGPNGYDQTITVTPQNGQFTARAGGGWQAVLPLEFGAPGMAWDTEDAGQYTLTLRLATLAAPWPYATPAPPPPPPTQVLVTRAFDVGSTGVRAEMLGASVTAGEMLVTVRYSHPSGINLSTIATGDVKVSIPGAGLVSATLVDGPLVGVNSVTAAYRVAEPAGGWAGVPGGRVQVRTGLMEVRAGNGESIGFALTRTVNVASGGRVVGVVKSAYTTASTLVVVMRYSSDSPIDLSTLGGDDLRLTGPFGYDELGALKQVLPQANGEVLAVYHFSPRGEALTWDFRVDNGRYDLSIQPGAISEVGGDTVADGFVRSFGLYFRNPVVEVITPAGRYNGGGQPGLLIDDVDAARVVLRYTTQDWRPHHQTSHFLTARLTGPNGYVSTWVLTRYTHVPYRSADYGNVTELDLRIVPPGWEWDAADSGVYTMTVYLGAGAEGQPVTEAVLTQQFSVDGAGPAMEVLSKMFSSTTMAATVRYTAPGGVNAATIDSNDVMLTTRTHHFLGGWAGISVMGTLVGAPSVAADGSVTAVYRFASPDGTPWTAATVALLSMKPQQVGDHAGNLASGGLLEYFTMFNAAPDLIGVGTLSATRSAWTVEVILRNAGGLIVPGSIQGSSLVVSAPGGRSTRVVVESVLTALDGSLRVRYRVMPQPGQVLVNGSYTLSLAANGISLGALGYLPAMTLGTFNDMVFS